MDGIRETLGILKDGIKRELDDLKLLKGEHFDRFYDIFNVPDDAQIYFNSYNIVINDPATHETLSPYLNQENLVIKVEVPEHNCYLWIYQYFNERIFVDYLKV